MFPAAPFEVHIFKIFLKFITVKQYENKSRPPIKDIQYA